MAEMTIINGQIKIGGTNNNSANNGGYYQYGQTRSYDPSKK